MAKRGYRGKHPHNDMKVPSGGNKAANYGKLTKEYNKTKGKLKYDYIKCHDGFNPRGEVEILFAAAVATDGKDITIISTDGFTKVYTSAAAQLLTGATAVWDSTGNANAKRDSLIDCVNAPDIAPAKAKATNALLMTDINVQDTEFTIKGGFVDGAFLDDCTIMTDESETTAPVGAAADTIAIGTNGDTDAEIQLRILKVFTGEADDNIIYATSGVGQAGVGLDGISGAEGSSATQITVTIDTAGTAGNASAVLADVSGESVVVEADTTGGAAKITPGHSGKIVASSGGAGIVKLIQDQPGPHGNTKVTCESLTKATVGGALTGYFTKG